MSLVPIGPFRSLLPSVGNNLRMTWRYHCHCLYQYPSENPWLDYCLAVDHCTWATCRREGDQRGDPQVLLMASS